MLAMGELSARFDTRQRLARQTLERHHDDDFGARSAAHGGPVGVGDEGLRQRTTSRAAWEDHGRGQPGLPLVRAGHRTLLWDLDPQGAATYLMRVRPRVKGGSPKLVLVPARGR